MLACLLSRFANTLRGALAWIGVSLVALAIGLVFALVTGNWFAFGVFAFILGALVVSAILTAFTLDVIACALSGLGLPAPAGGGSGSGSGPLTTELDCPTAQASLSDAKGRLARLQQEMDDQASKVRAAQDALATARTALTLSTAALVASFFFPWTIASAAAAVAASAFLVARSTRTLEAEIAVLQGVAARLSEAQQDVSAYEVVVTQTCRIRPVPGSPPAGITVRALRQLAGAH